MFKFSFGFVVQLSDWFIHWSKSEWNSIWLSQLDTCFWCTQGACDHPGRKVQRTIRRWHNLLPVHQTALHHLELPRLRWGFLQPATLCRRHDTRSHCGTNGHCGLCGRVVQWHIWLLCFDWSTASNETSKFGKMGLFALLHSILYLGPPMAQMFVTNKFHSKVTPLLTINLVCTTNSDN